MKHQACDPARAYMSHYYSKHTNQNSVSNVRSRKILQSVNTQTSLEYELLATYDKKQRSPIITKYWLNVGQ